MSELVLVANPKSNTITTYRLQADGLQPLASTEVATCGTFAIDEQRNLVYAASKQGPAVITLTLDRASGALTPQSRLAVDDAITYVTLAPGGRRLLLASYSGGFGTSHRIDEGDTVGVVGPEVGRVEHANLHSVVTSPDGRFAYFCSLGEDRLVQCSLGDDASLTPLDPPTVATPPTSGPRHIIISPDGAHAYVVTEFSGEVLHYLRDTTTGLLTASDTMSIVDPDAGLQHSAYGRDPRAEHLVWGADVHLRGTRMWASERCASTLATLTATPELQPVTSFVPTETQPRGFGVSPDGRRAVVAGEVSGHVSLYDLTGEQPRLLHRIASGDGANWVRIIEA